jgi:hypothetical protein
MFAKSPPATRSAGCSTLSCRTARKLELYAKLTGPRATIAEHGAFREFIRSAKFNRPATK